MLCRRRLVIVIMLHHRAFQKYSKPACPSTGRSASRSAYALTKLRRMRRKLMKGIGVREIALRNVNHGPIDTELNIANIRASV